MMFLNKFHGIKPQILNKFECKKICISKTINYLSDLRAKSTR
jgi:hypothetical protein